MWKPLALSLAIICLSAPALAQANASPDAGPRMGTGCLIPIHPPSRITRPRIVTTCLTSIDGLTSLRPGLTPIKDPISPRHG